MDAFDVKGTSDRIKQAETERPHNLVKIIQNFTQTHQLMTPQNWESVQLQILHRQLLGLRLSNLRFQQVVQLPLHPRHQLNRFRH